MRNTTLSVLASCLLAACGAGSSVEIVGDEVRVATTQLDITFARDGSVAETYMIFGGLDSDRADMASKITLVGLGMSEARPIYDEYPDFTRCSSAGATLAQRATKQLDIVPANDAVLAVLQDALARHEAGLQSGGDRVCVAVTGSSLSWRSAKVDGEEVLSQLPAAVRREHVFVESARLVPASEALDAP